MDFAIAIRYLLAVSIACMIVEASTLATDRLRTHKRRRNRLEKSEVTGADTHVTKTKKTKPCCLNDGICIMNAFCHCKKNFYGRRCEHQQRHRSCGTLSHGTWMSVSCHLCHCFDGQITCKTSILKGCENMPYTEGIEAEPTFNVAMDNKVEDYDRFYDDYEEQPAKSPAMSHFINRPLVIVTAILTIIRRCGS